MKSFNYTVKDEVGIHARPAGLLVKEVKKVEVQVEGDDEDTAFDALKGFFEANL